MIIGIGCDTVAHTLTEELGWKSDEGILQRIFSRQELDLYNSKKTIKFLSGRFAVKEAVLKCIGTGMQDGISLSDIEILPDILGKPSIKLMGRIKEICAEMGINLWHVSISHTSGYSIAFVIAES